MSRPVLTERPVPSVIPESLSDLPAFHQRLMASRGVSDLAMLDLNLTGLLHYESLKDIHKAANLLADAIIRQEKVIVIGDFDTDGATATALAVSQLKLFGLNNVRYLVPDRFKMGYGLSVPLTDLASEESPDIILTVDNGISSLAGVRRANELGIKVVITDHHLPGDQLPDAEAIVNPNQPGCRFESKAACGCAIIFYLMAALRAELITRNVFSVASAPQLSSALDLVALATVADVVPLDRNNRILVRQGLDRMRAGLLRPGIQAILELAGKDLNYLTETDLGFAVAPRLNAAGRLDDMSLGIACLLADDTDAANLLAGRLHQLNMERREIEQEMNFQAMSDMDALINTDEELPAALVLFQPDWHEGVIGILASRLKERFHRPVFVFAQAENGSFKGSGRSINGFHLRDALARVDASYPGMIERFGGHAMAAGLALAQDDIALFRDQFTKIASDSLTADQLESRLLTDGELPGDMLTIDLVNDIESLGPWGQQFPEPVFHGHFEVVHAKVLNEKHLKLQLTCPGLTRPVDAIWFNVPEHFWPGNAARVHTIYQPEINRFRGRESLQLIIRHLEPAGQ